MTEEEDSVRRSEPLAEPTAHAPSPESSRADHQLRDTTVTQALPSRDSSQPHETMPTPDGAGTLHGASDGLNGDSPDDTCITCGERMEECVEIQTSHTLFSTKMTEHTQSPTPDPVRLKPTYPCWLKKLWRLREP